MTTQTMETLEAERQRLAFDARQGDPEAARRLGAVERQLADLALQAEREALAERERGVRDTEARQREEAERRERAERELRQLAAARLAGAREVETAMDHLVAVAERLTGIGRRMYALTGELGNPRRRLLLEGPIENYVRWRLSTVVEGMGRPPQFFRRSLVDVLAGESEPPEPAA